MFFCGSACHWHTIEHSYYELLHLHRHHMAHIFEVNACTWYHLLYNRAGTLTVCTSTTLLVAIITKFGNFVQVCAISRSLCTMFDILSFYTKIHTRSLKTIQKYSNNAPTPWCTFSARSLCRSPPRGSAVRSDLGWMMLSPLRGRSRQGT